MGKILDHIDTWTQEFVRAQPMFFVATAPLTPKGHVNLSPKGHDSFRVLSDNRVAYLDLGGSGIETTAHLRENGRITVMFMALSGSPMIVRLYGRGRTVEPGQDEYASLLTHFPEYVQPRAVIIIDVHRVSHSCGYGVPKMTVQGPRDQLARWTEKKGHQGVLDYRRDKNLLSIDGLPGLTEPQE